MLETARSGAVRWYGRWPFLAACVLGVASFLRFWRLGWGLGPPQAWFCEEILSSGPAAGWVPLSWNSLDTTNLVYPPLYSYLAGATTALAHLLGLQPTPRIFNPETIFTSRIPAALAGIATVWLVGRLAMRMAHGTDAAAARTGLTAAALLAVAPLHAMDSHRAGTDVLVTFAAALTMTASWTLIRAPSPGRAVLAGIAAGIAFGSKQTGLAMVVPVAWACAEVAYVRRSPRTLISYGLLAFVGALLAWALCCPPCLYRFGSFIGAMNAHRRISMGEGGAMNHLVPTLGWLGHPYIYELGASLPYSLGWPLYLLALYGVAKAIRRHAAADRLLLATIAPYFAFIGSAPVTFPRYLLPLFPGLAVAAARALWGADDRRQGVRAVLLGFVLFYSLVLTTTQVARFSVAQRRELAAFTREAVRAPRPLGAARAPIRVAVPLLSPALDYYRVYNAVVDAGMHPVIVDNGHWFEQTYDAFVLPHYVPIRARRDGDRPEVLRDLERLESGEAGFYRAKRYGSWYLQRDLYTWLDPGFYGDLWQGDIGYDVYLPIPVRGSDR